MLFERPAGTDSQNLIERRAMDILHDNIMRALQREVIIDFRKVRMREPREHPCLGPEQSEGLSRLCRRHRTHSKLFESQNLSPLIVVGDFIYTSHTAFAEGIQNLVSFFEQLLHRNTLSRIYH